MKLKTIDIMGDVKKVLEKAATGKGRKRHYLTAYQILERLPQRDILIQQRGGAGAGAGVHFGAASLVQRAARKIPGVKVSYMDAVDARFLVAGDWVEPGYKVIGLYRLRKSKRTK